MNPEIEAEKQAIALGYQQQLTSALISDLAVARVEIRRLKAEIEAAKPKDNPIPPA